MKILGIGVDIIDNKRIKESIKNNKFRRRIYSSKELKLSKKTKNKVAFFSKRFAAKEAFSKALGTGFSSNLNFKDIEITNDPMNAVEDADVVMTDTFISIHNTDKDRLSKFLPKFQVNSDLMKNAKKDAIFLHCLPAKRDQEVTTDVIDGPQSVIWDEAENRLHVQKALLVSLLNV